MGTSIIRTFTPVLAGAIVTWLVGLGVEIDAASVGVVLSGIFTGLWYVIARFLEQKFPAAGWLLGKPQQPTYDA